MPLPVAQLDLTTMHFYFVNEVASNTWNFK